MLWRSISRSYAMTNGISRRRLFSRVPTRYATLKISISKVNKIFCFFFLNHQHCVLYPLISAYFTIRLYFSQFHLFVSRDFPFWRCASSKFLVFFFIFSHFFLFTTTTAKCIDMVVSLFFWARADFLTTFGGSLFFTTWCASRAKKWRTDFYVSLRTWELWCFKIYIYFFYMLTLLVFVVDFLIQRCRSR